MRTASLLLSGVLTVLVVFGPLVAQQDPGHSSRFRPPDPVDNPATEVKVALGRDLFESTLLSRNKKISCATCHDPSESFADGMRESLGIFETEVGKNSPTLWGIALHPGFLGPEPKPQNGIPAKVLPQLSLEGRCVSPIENPVEMGNTIGEAVRTLRAVRGMSHRFDDAFGKPGLGVRPDRIGRAIAAYLRTIEVPDTGFRKFAEGNGDALADAELRGLAIFRSRGECASCHSGPYLSDGRFHVVEPSNSFRSLQRSRNAHKRNQELQQAQAAGKDDTTTRFPNSALTPSRASTGRSLDDLVRRIQQSQPTGGYGSEQFTRATGAQTPTLWDVARTPPYFRDGSVANLEVAVRQHVTELRGVTQVVPGCGGMPVANDDRLPKTLRPTWTLAQQPTPHELNDDEMADLMAFLYSLSPKS
jgi:cytochrome c peroxidase